MLRNAGLPTLILLMVGITTISECPGQEYAAAAYLQAGSSYTSDSRCLLCHKSKENNNGWLERVNLDETIVWTDEDHHKNAMIVLKGDRAQKMEELLGYDNVETDVRCINCHAGNCEPAAPPNLEKQPLSLKAFEGDLAEQGVSCQSCHGPATKWFDPHSDPKLKWWDLAREQKMATGLRDVRHPTTRAEVCLSCHLGSSREGKILTHEMYAAGHPPLPNFEVESFMAVMPYHGKRLLDKSEESRPEWFNAKELYKTRSVITSAVVAMKLQVQLIADEARWYDPTKAATDDNHWPKLALYDCAACHHDLRMERKEHPDRSAVEFVSWRQARGYYGTPGRPMPRTWPTALYRAAGLDLDAFATLQNVFSRQPFGNPTAVAKAAQDLVSKLDEELKEVDKAVDSASAFKYLRSICEVGGDAPLDYDDARQLAFAVKVISEELGAALSGDQKKAVTEAVTEWIDTLALALPKREVDSKAGSAPLKANKASLEKAREYDPAQFQDRMRTLSKSLAVSAG